MTQSVPKSPAKLSQEQAHYMRALVFWMSEFGYSSPHSKMQREEEEKARSKAPEKKSATQEHPKYKLGMGHAREIIGATVDEKNKAHKENLARYNFNIFYARLRLDAREAEEVHESMKQRFQQIGRDYEARVWDLNSALESVLKSGLSFSPDVVLPKVVTEEDRRNPPLRPQERRFIKDLDTWTITL